MSKLTPAKAGSPPLLPQAADSENEDIRKQVRLLKLLVFVALIFSALVVALYLLNFGSQRFSVKQEDWGQFGDYVAGLLNPMFSFLAIIGLLTTLGLQQKTIRLQQAQLLEGSKQVKETTNALNLDAYWQIEASLQKDEVIRARRRLHELCEKKDYNGIVLDPRGTIRQHWSLKDETEVEVVCRTFNFVGTLVKSGYFHPDLFLQNWGMTIIRCWERTDGLVTARRESQNEKNLKLWLHYDSLYADACKYWNQPPIRQIERIQP